MAGNTQSRKIGCNIGGTSPKCYPEAFSNDQFTGHGYVGKGRGYMISDNDSGTNDRLHERLIPKKI
jgi:hypothetical protein